MARMTQLQINRLESRMKEMVQKAMQSKFTAVEAEDEDAIEERLSDLYPTVGKMVAALAAGKLVVKETSLNDSSNYSIHVSSFCEARFASKYTKAAKKADEKRTAARQKFKESAHAEITRLIDKMVFSGTFNIEGYLTSFEQFLAKNA